jgi:hypothetical protein
MVDPARLGALLERLRDTEHELLRLRELGVESVRSDTDRSELLHADSLRDLSSFREQVSGRASRS